MREQAEIAMDTADVICFFTDAREGLTEDDREVANLLRRTRKPVILVVNKVDYQGVSDHMYEFYELGLGDPIGISSVNMLGFGDLLDVILSRRPGIAFTEEEKEHPLQLAIVGRPNVGKSSLTNRLLGQNRTMVSDLAGTTRDAIDTLYTAPDGTRYNIIDTAGIRRKRAVEAESLERYSVLRSIAAIRRCDVALLMLDANDGVTEQDTKIAGLIREEGKACILLVNKWDQVEKETGTFEKVRKKILADLKFMDFCPVMFISALTGQRIDRIFELINFVHDQTNMRITTGMLNDVLADAQARVQPPTDNGRRLKIFYMTQTGVCPPSFVIFCNKKDLFHFSYQRYLENQIRAVFGMEGSPIRITIRQKGDE
jgi:GTP-binding protein